MTRCPPLSTLAGVEETATFTTTAEGTPGFIVHCIHGHVFGSGISMEVVTCGNGTWNTTGCHRKNYLQL